MPVPLGTLVKPAAHVKQPSLPEWKQDAQLSLQATQVPASSLLMQPGEGAPDARQGSATHSVATPNLGGNLTWSAMQSTQSASPPPMHDLQLPPQATQVPSAILYLPSSQSSTTQEPITSYAGGHFTLPSVFVAHL